MNFTIGQIIWEDSYGTYDAKTLQWTGVIGMVERHEVDIGASPTCMTDKRLDAVDFTIPMAAGESLLYMKKLDGARIQWKAYFKVLMNSLFL